MTTNIANLPTTLQGGFTVTPTSGWYDSYQFQYAAGALSASGQAVGGQPIDITGIDFRTQVRSAAGQRVLLDASTFNDLILVDGPLGQISFNVPKDQPATGTHWHMGSLQPGIYYCDIVALADGKVMNLCQTGPLTFQVNGGYTDTDAPVT